MESIPQSISIETANPISLLRDKVEQARVLRLRKGTVHTDRLKQKIDQELAQIQSAINVLCLQIASTANTRTA